MASIGFKNVYYDMYHSRMHHWYTDENGRSRHDEVDVEHDYYLYDESGESTTKDIYGASVKREVAKHYSDLKMLLDSGVKTCEAKISQEMKFLHKTYADQIIKTDIKDFNIGIIDIEVACTEFPKVEQAKFPINLISIWLSKTDEVYTFGLQDYTGDDVKNYIYCADERILLRKFLQFFRKCRLNIVSGWNVKLFDIPYIINRCKYLNENRTDAENELVKSVNYDREVQAMVDNPFELPSLSPLNIYKENHKQEGYHTDGGGYSLAGLSTLDYIDLYKNFTYTKREKYGLDAICSIEINEGKLRYEGELNNLWKDDWNTFVEYNVQDVLLVKKLDQKLRLFDLAVSMCHQSLIPLEKVFSSVNLVTGMVLKYCHRKGIVIPDRQGSVEHTKFAGAHVMANVGYYKWCENFDIVSMYPHVIMAFNLSPETLVYSPDDNSDLIKTPIDGIYYKKQLGILPELIKDLFDSRVVLQSKYDVCIGMQQGLEDDEISKRFKMDKKQIPFLKAQIEEEKGNASYYDLCQKVVKIYMNSTYGATGSPFFCLYNVDISRTVTAVGRDLIKYLTNRTDNYLIKHWHDIAKKIVPKFVKVEKVTPLQKEVVCLIDTDSGHVCFDEMLQSIGMEIKDNSEFLEFTHTLNEKFFIPFYDKILDIYAEKYDIKQIFKFKPEKIITKKIVIAMKKYVDEIIEKKGQRFDPPKLSITGIEIVRTDTPRFCRERIKDVVNTILRTEDKTKVLDCIREIKRDFFKCSPDEIAKPKGIGDYKKYAQSLEYYQKNGIHYSKLPPIHNRASINYNYIVDKYKLPLKYIDDKEKVKFVYLYDNNEINQNVIAMISKWPDKFNELFNVNYEAQWSVTFEEVIARFFKAMNWGTINLESNSLEEMFN